MIKNHPNSRQKYNLMVNNTKDIIIFFKRNGLVVDCNEAAKDILGYGDDILNTNISDIFRDAASLKNNCLLVDSRYCDITNETIAYKKNQTCISIELKIILKETRKSFTGLCIASDITLQKKLMGKVKHLRKDMKRLLMLRNTAVSNIIHELRTPVSGIMGMSEILMDTKLNSEQKDIVNIVYKCCKNLNSLINALFDIVKMKSNKPILKEQKFSIHFIIDKVVMIYEKSIIEKHLKLIVNISEDIPEYLIGDDHRLAQIIDNLLSNAVKFTHNGEIRLNVSMTAYNGDGVELLFRITDTGIGIDAENIHKIFMTYYQVDGSTTRRYGGIGLGLSICQMFVKAMGGRISVESTKGKGSTFSFSVFFKSATEYIEDKTKASKAIDNTAIITENDNYFKEKYVDKLFDEQLLLETLKIAIEAENWIYAEQIALKVRESISNEDKNITNNVLQLLFSIRKENRDLSIKRVEELIQMYIE